MSINLTKLENVSLFELNDSILQGDIFNNMTTYTLNLYGDVYTYAIFFIIFVYLFYEFYRKDGYITYDLLRALNLSAGITMIIGLVLISIGFATSFRALIILGFVFIITLFSVYKIKKTGM